MSVSAAWATAFSAFGGLGFFSHPSVISSSLAQTRVKSTSAANRDGPTEENRIKGVRNARTHSPYLASPDNSAHGALDIHLEALIETAQMRQASMPPARLALSNYRHAYWSAAQLVAHHTVNGCNLQAGDLLGSGTLSGPTPDSAGALLELTEGGKKPVRLPNGESRTWLMDGDAVTLRGWCQGPGAVRIGFGECSARVLPAR